MDDATPRRVRRLVTSFGGCALLVGGAVMAASCGSGSASKTGTGGTGTTGSGGTSTTTTTASATGGSPTTTTGTGGTTTTTAGTGGGAPSGGLPAGWLYTKGSKIYVSNGQAGGRRGWAAGSTSMHLPLRLQLHAVDDRPRADARDHDDRLMTGGSRASCGSR